MLVNARKLSEFLRESEAPVVLRCPDCEETFLRHHWWQALQAGDLAVLCVCGFTFTVPRFFADVTPSDPGPVISLTLHHRRHGDRTCS